MSELLRKMSPGRQTLLFSATMPSTLAEFASAGLNAPQLVRLDTERKISPELGLAFFTCRCACMCLLCVFVCQTTCRCTGMSGKPRSGNPGAGAWQESAHGRFCSVPLCPA